MATIEAYSDPILERNTLSILIQSGETNLHYFHTLVPKHFTDESLQRLYTILRRIAIAGVQPTLEILRVELQKLYPKAVDIRTGLMDLYNQLVSAPILDDITYLVEQMLIFERVRMMLTGMQSTLNLLNNGDVVRSLSQYQEDALSLQITDRSLPVTRGSVFGSFDKRLQILEDKQANPDKYHGVYTGIGELDAVTSGLWKGELGFVFGKSGVGKSFFLLNCALHGYLSGLNVLVIPIEMPELQWSTRFDSRISHVPYEQFKRATMSDIEKVIWKDRIDQLRDLYPAHDRDIYLSHIPIGCTVTSVRAELEHYRRRNLPIGLLIIDYADLMSPPRTLFSEQSELTAIFRELKGIAIAYDIPIWTASQARKEAYNKVNLQMDDIGYAMGKIHVSDLVVGIGQTDDFKITNRLSLSVAKFRDGTYNKPIMLRANLAVAMIHDVS